MRRRPYRETAGEPEVCIRACSLQRHQLLHKFGSPSMNSSEANNDHTKYALLQGSALRTAGNNVILAQDAYLKCLARSILSVSSVP